MEELKILFYPSLIPEGHLLWLSSAYTCRVLCAGWLDKHIWHCTYPYPRNTASRYSRIRGWHPLFYSCISDRFLEIPSSCFCSFASPCLKVALEAWFVWFSSVFQPYCPSRGYGTGLIAFVRTDSSFALCF